MIPDAERERVEAWLASFVLRRVPPSLATELQLTHTIRGNDVILVERRPAWRRPGEWTELAVARFRYRPTARDWVLYCRDHPERWRKYDDLDATPRFLTLLAEVHLDPTGIFWG